MTRRLTKHVALGPVFLEACAALYLGLQPLPWLAAIFPIGFCIVISLVMGVKVYSARTAAQYYLWVGLLWFCTSVVIFITSLSLLALHLTGYHTQIWAFLVGYPVSFYGIWRLYEPVWHQTLPVDQDSGHIDLLAGTVCPIIPKATFHFRSSLLEKISTIVAANGVIVAMLGANMGMRMQQSAFTYKELISDFIIYLLAVLLLFVVVSSFYTYRFICRWEKSTGRTMWIKGFEPGAQSS